MKVHADFSALRRTKWYEYAIRFLFGGIITAITGMIAKKFGPQVGGLFLAFPAIFPASPSLEKLREMLGRVLPPAAQISSQSTR